jgi:hypothetical protein
MKKSFLFIAFSFLIFSKLTFAGDTIRVMHYNLLYYDKIVYNCNEVNNNVDNKDDYLRTITGHFKPDIFTVNEMNAHISSVNRLLNNVFNTDGKSNYKRGAYTGSFIVNMLYYNSDKLELKWQGNVQTSPRQTDVYKLYYKSKELEQNDTTFITCFVTHLKAGKDKQGSNELELERDAAAKQIMNYIKNRNIQGNILLMGDFNVYTSAEAAFQTFMTPSTTDVRFYDPVDALGAWQDNPTFAKYHTQSTMTSGDCHSGGGMDDRFDFILATNSILEGTLGAQYVEDSYWAYGQDGNRLNKSLINPSNQSLPSNVINALYYNSDHLPVVMKLFVDATPMVGNEHMSDVKSHIRFQNPFDNNIKIWNDLSKPETARIKIVNILGSLVLDKTVNLLPGNEISINAKQLNKGLYFVEISGNGFRDVAKLIKY